MSRCFDIDVYMHYRVQFVKLFCLGYPSEGNSLVFCSAFRGRGFSCWLPALKSAAEDFEPTFETALVVRASVEQVVIQQFGVTGFDIAF